VNPMATTSPFPFPFNICPPAPGSLLRRTGSVYQNLREQYEDHARCAVGRRVELEQHHCCRRRARSVREDDYSGNTYPVILAVSRFYLSSTPHSRCLPPERAGYSTNAEARPMRFASEELVRVIVSAVLRSAPWTHAFLCYLCLLNLLLEHLGPAYKESEVRPSMDRVFESPGALMYLQSFRCAKCQYTLACLGFR